MEIVKIDISGVVTVQFSDVMVVPADLNTLKEKKIELDGEKKSNLELTIDPVEGQTSAQVKFDWSVQQFTGRQLLLQLKFDDPYEISTSEDLTNRLRVQVWNTNLFIRASDGASIENLVSSEFKIPRVTPEDSLNTSKTIGDGISYIGKTSIFLTAILLFVGYSVNIVLSQVRSLSLITHLMIMQVNYPGVSVIFFSKVFEFVTFDLLHGFFPQLESLSEQLFGGVNVPYSDEAQNIGYESRYMLTNLGSIPVIILFIIALQLLYSVVFKCSKPGGRVNGFAGRKIANFRWSGFHNLFNELYLTMCFSIAINTSAMDFISVGVAVNNVLALLCGSALLGMPPFIAVKLIKNWKASAYADT